MKSAANHTLLRDAMKAFFHAYQAFTDKPDEMLAKRGLARVHHRILFFVALHPGLSVKDLLACLGVVIDINRCLFCDLIFPYFSRYLLMVQRSHVLFPNNSYHAITAD